MGQETPKTEHDIVSKNTPANDNTPPTLEQKNELLRKENLKHEEAARMDFVESMIKEEVLREVGESSKATTSEAPQQEGIEDVTALIRKLMEVLSDKDRIALAQMIHDINIGTPTEGKVYGFLTPEREKEMMELLKTRTEGELKAIAMPLLDEAQKRANERITKLEASVRQAAVGPGQTDEKKSWFSWRPKTIDVSTLPNQTANKKGGWFKWLIFGNKEKGGL